MESVPKESETIAKKRALRISEKIRQAREKMALKNSWWTSETTEILGLTVLFAINFLMLLPLIGQPANSTQLSGPVVPIIAKFITLFGPPFEYAVRLVNVIFFLILPISFYAFVKFVSGRKFAAFLSTLILSLPFVFFAQSRVEFGILSHESAYIASISFIPLALTMLLKFLRSGGIKNLFLSGLMGALIALTSPFGVFIFLILSAVTTFSEMLLGEGRIKILRFITVTIYAAAFSSFWYSPGIFAWMLTGPMGSEFRSMVSHVIPLSFFVVPVLACIGYLIFDRKPHLQPFFLALFYTLTFLIIVVAGAGYIPSNPGRYVPMLGFSLAFLIGIGTLMGYEHLHFTKLSQIIPIKGTKDAFLILVAIGLITLSITSRGRVVPETENVLGLFTEVQKGDIWNARDKFSAGKSVYGYLISFSAFGSLMYLSRKRGNI